MNATGPSAPRARRGVDELEAVDLEADERLREVAGPRSRRGGSPRPCWRGSGRRRSCRRSAATSSILDSPTPRKAIRTRSDGDVHDVSSSSPSMSRQRPERLLDRADDERDVVDLADAADRLGGTARRHDRCHRRRAYPVGHAIRRPESAIVVRVRCRRRSSGSRQRWDRAAGPVPGPCHGPLPVRCRRPTWASTSAARSQDRRRARAVRRPVRQQVGRFPTVV